MDSKELLISADLSRRFGPELFWSRSVREKVGIENLPFLDELSHAYQNRLQRIILGTQIEKYYWHHKEFLQDFLVSPRTAIRDSSELMLAGFESEFDRVEPIVRARREEIKAASGREPKKIAVFIGDGYTMDESYRAIGLGNAPFYTYALSGGLDAYLNAGSWHYSPLGKPRDPDRPVLKRVIGHEPSHALYNSVFVDENDKPTWQLDKNRMVFEALGGPLNPAKWENVDISKIISVDFTPLETAVSQITNGFPAEDNFRSWLNTTSERNGIYGYHPLSSPTWAVFYQWAYQKGDEKYWYELGRKLH